MRIIFWIFMGCAISSHAFGEDPIQQRLDQLYAEYEAAIANPTVKKYVELDGKLRAFLAEELPKFDDLFKIEKHEDYYKYDKALGPRAQLPWWYNMTLDDLKTGNVNTMNFCAD